MSSKKILKPEPKDFLASQKIIKVLFNGLDINPLTPGQEYNEKDAVRAIKSLKRASLKKAFKSLGISKPFKDAESYPIRCINELIKTIAGASIERRQVQKQREKMRVYYIEKKSLRKLKKFFI